MPTRNTCFCALPLLRSVSAPLCFRDCSHILVPAADKSFDTELFIRKIQRCLTLSGRDAVQDISNSAYNVGTFSKYRKEGDAGGLGAKKRNAAEFFADVAKRIPAALHAMLHQPSAEKTFQILQETLGVSTFPAYNITLDLGYYHRGLCDENQFDYIGPGAKPAVHYLRREPYEWRWGVVRAAPPPGTAVRLDKRSGSILHRNQAGADDGGSVEIRWSDGQTTTNPLTGGASGLEQRRLRAPTAHTNETYGAVMRALQAAVPDLCRRIGVDADVEFEGLPMAELPCGNMGLNLQVRSRSVRSHWFSMHERRGLKVSCN